MIVRFSSPKLLSPSSRISYGFTTLKYKSEIVFATRKPRPAWIFVVCTACMLLVGYQTTTLNHRHGATGYQEAINNSNQALPLVSNASPFQRSEFPANEIYDDHEENRSVRSEDFDGRSRFTSNCN